jgi:hypothetical protein
VATLLIACAVVVPIACGNVENPKAPPVSAGLFRWGALSGTGKMSIETIAQGLFEHRR